MKRMISNAKITVFLSLTLVLLFSVSCKKETETTQKETGKVTLKDFNPKTCLSESEYNKLMQKEAKAMPATLSDEEINASRLQVKSGQACTPAVTFNTTWNSGQAKYNCSSAHNVCTLATYPGIGTFIFVGTDYYFKTYWCMTINGTYQEGELNTGWQENDYDVTFNINNPTAPGKYYFVRCNWRNLYYSNIYGWYVETGQVDSQKKFLAYVAPPPPAFSVSISGPVKGYNNVQYTWKANPANGNGTITYQWYYSSDQGQTYPYTWGTGQIRTAYLPNEQDLYIKVIATASNGTATDDFMTMNLGDQP